MEIVKKAQERISFNDEYTLDLEIDGVVRKLCVYCSSEEGTEYHGRDAQTEEWFEYLSDDESDAIYDYITGSSWRV